MSTITPKEIDRRYLFYDKDGFLDVFIGLGILFAGLFVRTELAWMAAIFVPAFMPAWQSARQRFLQRRLGEPQDDLQQNTPNQKALMSVTLLMGILLLAGIGMVFAFGLMSGPLNDWLRQYFLLALGTIFGSVWLLAAVMLKLKRFYLYAAFTFVALGAAQFTVLPFWLALMILGGLMTSIGLLILIRFLQDHPILE